MSELEKLINHYNYTKETIAKELGITELAVDNWLKGRNGIGEENQRKLVVLLESVSSRRDGEKWGGVIIPHYVANLIERSKKDGGRLLSFNSFVMKLKAMKNVDAEKTFDWINDHEKTTQASEANEKIALAWINGYHVPTRKYAIIITRQFERKPNDFAGIYSCYVEHSTLLKDGRFLQYKGIDNCMFNPTTEKEPCFAKENHPITKDAKAQELKYQFTEKEIKLIDDRLWAFAEEIKD